MLDEFVNGIDDLNDDNNDELDYFEKIQEKAQGLALTREECLQVAKKLPTCPDVTKLRRYLSPKSTAHIKKVVLSYVNYAIFYQMLLNENGDNSSLTWGPSCSEDSNIEHGMHYGETITLEEAMQNDMCIMYGCNCLPMFKNLNNKNQDLIADIYPVKNKRSSVRVKSKKTIKYKWWPYLLALVLFLVFRDPTHKITASSLKVHSKPSISSPVIFAVYKNDSVKIVETRDDWSLILVDDKKGWVSNKYVE